MESLTLTNFAGLNVASPEMELSTSPVESPNIINAIMEEGTIYCRAPQNKYYSFGDGKKVSAIYTGKLGNTKLEFAQVDNKIYRRGGSFEVWWNNAWTYKRVIEIRNNSVERYENGILDLRLPAGFDYSGFKANGEDIRFISWDNNQVTELSYWIKRWGKGIVQTTLRAAIDAGTTIIPVVSTGTYPNEGIILIEDEKIYYGSKDTNSFRDCIRGYESNASAHLTGKAVNYEGCIYVKIPVIEAMTTKKIEMYYGNVTAEAKSDINKIITYIPFNTQDDLQKLDTSWWYNYTPIIENGVLKNYSRDLGGWLSLKRKVEKSFSFKFKVKMLMTTRGQMGINIWGTTIFDSIFFQLINNPTQQVLSFYQMRDMGSYVFHDKIPYAYILNQFYTFIIDYDSITKKVRGTLIEGDSKVIYSRSFTSAIITTLSDWKMSIQVEIIGNIPTSPVHTSSCDELELSTFLPNIVNYTLGVQQSKTSDVEWTELFTGNSNKSYQILNFADVTKNKNYIIFINGDEVVRKWDGTAVTELPMPNIKCKFGVVHKRRLWLFNFTGLYDGSKLWYSNIDAIDTLTDWQTKGVNNIEYINQGDGFEITAVGIMSDCIVIWKENTAYLLYGDIPNHAVKKLNIDVGCLAWRSVADWEDGNFFLSRKGIHYIRGATAETPMIFTVDNIRTDNLAEKIMPLFNNLNTAYLKNAIGCVWKDRYFCTIPLYKSEVNDILLVLDYKAGWWSYWVPPEPITAMFVDPVDNIFYIGTTNGNIRIQETRNLKTDEELKEDGNLISSIYETGYIDLGIPNIRKRLRFLDLLFSKNITIELEIDKVLKTIGNFENGEILTKKRIPLLNVGRFFKLRFKDFNKQVHSATLHYKYLRT